MQIKLKKPKDLFLLAAGNVVEAVEKGQETFPTRNWSINELKIAPILKIWSTHHRKYIQILRRSAVDKRGGRVFLQPRYEA